MRWDGRVVGVHSRDSTAADTVHGSQCLVGLHESNTALQRAGSHLAIK